MRSSSADREAVIAAFDRLAAAVDEVLSLPLHVLVVPELLAMLERLEIQRRRQPAVEHKLVQQLRSRTSPGELGGRNWSQVLQHRLRIGAGEAGRRLDEADDLGSRTAISGEPLAPRLPTVAQQQAAGTIGAEHVRIIRRFFASLPAAVDIGTREAAESHLAAIAAEHTPLGLSKAADRLLALVHPDGQFSDADRARRRFVTIDKQQPDGMSPIKGLLDPQARAGLEAVLAKWAAPGMCNPDDETPCVAGTPSQAHIQGDTRAPGQRHHDALTAACRAVLASGELGQHHGLPATIIVSTTLQELQSGIGQGVTAGGTRMPMPDVIRLASHAYHYLAVFDQHTSLPLYLGRTRRIASAAQRIVLLARDRGCTYPGCDVPGFWCEAHHINDWARGGHTNVDELTLACPPHNGIVKPGGWATRMRKDGRTEWLPPPHLDCGQARVNDIHHPENLLSPKEENGP